MTDSQTYYHGTKADRKVGDPIENRAMLPIRILGEVMNWKGHSPDQLKEMHDHLENLKQRGVEAIEE